MEGSTRLGDILIAEGIVTRDQLDQALGAQLVDGARLGQEVVDLGLASADDVARALAIQKGVPAARRKHFERVDPSIASLVPAELARKYHAVPIGVTAKGVQELVMAMRDPDDREAIDEIGFLTGARIRAAVAPACLIREFLDKLYPADAGETTPEPESEPDSPMLELSDPVAPAPAPDAPMLELDDPVAPAPAPDAPMLELGDPVGGSAGSDAGLSLDLAERPAPAATPSYGGGGLELAEQPPRAPSPPPPHVGSASDPLPPPAYQSGGSDNSLLIKAIGGVLVALLAGWFIKGQACDSKHEEVDVGRQLYHDDHVGMSVMFPPGWRLLPDQRLSENNPIRQRGSIYYAGGSQEVPDQVFLLIGADTGGVLPDPMPDTTFRLMLDEVRRASSQTQMGMTLALTSCEVTSVRTAQTGECIGTAQYKGKQWNATFYLWFESGKMVMAAFLMQGPREQSLGTIQQMLSSIQLDP